MTDTEITALAREYAEWVLSIPESEELPNCLRREATDTLVEEAEEVLTWLLRRYCLVEKSKVDNIYKGILVQQDPKNFGYSAYNQGRKELLESLFPEIAKEVEE